MRRAPILLAAVPPLLLTLGCASTGNTDESATPVGNTIWSNSADATLGRVVGIGGIFFRADDPRTLETWYESNLGMPSDTQGYTLLWWRDATTGTIASTTWSPASRDSAYFDIDQQLMINYVVDDLDAIRAKLIEAGVRVDEKVEDYEYGRFGWAWDLEGNKVELWEMNIDFARKAFGSASWGDVE